ncbi:hypothetical protein HYV11_03770 [Candidatus Dependentiae bacterium]|nr:hypothetical protein [Candidatus Dependentiae bacterium]
MYKKKLMIFLIAESFVFTLFCSDELKKKSFFHSPPLKKLTLLSLDPCGEMGGELFLSQKGMLKSRETFFLDETEKECLDDSVAQKADLAKLATEKSLFERIRPDNETIQFMKDFNDKRVNDHGLCNTQAEQLRHDLYVAWVYADSAAKRNELNGLLIKLENINKAVVLKKVSLLKLQEQVALILDFLNKS